MAGKQKSGISGKRHGLMPIPWERSSWGKLGEEEDDEEDPVTERRREYTVLGLDLGKREEQIALE